MTRCCFHAQIKPDGVQRGIIGEVIKRFEQKGFRLVALKMTQVTVRLPPRAASMQLPYASTNRLLQAADDCQMPRSRSNLSLPDTKPSPSASV